MERGSTRASSATTLRVAPKRVASLGTRGQYSTVMARDWIFSCVGILVSSLAGVSCSAPPGTGDDDAVPEFRGTLPGVAPAGASATTPGAAPASGTPVGVTPPEVIGSQPGSLPVDTSGTNDTGSMGAANGAGGSASVSPQTPAAPSNGAGGSAMPSAAGGGNMPVGTPPPVDNPEPTFPPPIDTPPPVNNPPPPNPGAVGTGCAPGAAFFCEDFEALAVGTATATNGWRPEGTLSIDSQVAQGSRSLHLQANGGQFSRIVLNSFAPPNNSFFGRMNVFVQQFPTAPNFSHFVLVEVTGSSGERVRPIGGQFISEGNGPSTYWGVGSDGGATGDWTKWEPRVLTENARWICMEWQMSAADNSVHVFIDGTERTELGVSTNSHGGGGSPFMFPTFNSIWLGWWNFQGGTTPAQFNIWLDDIVLSSQRVGCN
jgi:hypothetical protein